MTINKRAFEAFMLALHENGHTGRGIKKCLEAYEAAKAEEQPSMSIRLTPNQTRD